MQRRAIDLRGIVQGVGFRPFVYALASRLHLSGFVLNHAGGVAIEIEGEAETLDRFQRELTGSAPSLAHIEAVDTRPMALRGDRCFRIEDSSVEGIASLAMSPDVATCDDCLRELFDPRDRRFRYPFINCTACGPRLTIVTGSPYDRERTTMASFVMCAACRTEYRSPANRRFHAEPIACAVCGPRLALRGADGSHLERDPIDAAVEAILAGHLVALKGLGGFHLACDAANPAAVALLRRRKHRDDKPFAVMVPSLAGAASLCEIGSNGEALLRSPARPIVLLPKRARIRVADAVAPEGTHLGVMLPYAPLHHLLMAQLGDRVVVMTSGNRSDEPIAIDNAEAIEQLRGIADLFVVHDRPIHVRCDDSVVRQAGVLPIPIRRSRGYAPAPIALPWSCAEPILAVGGQLKSTFALGRGRQAVVSHHLGDLDDLRAYEAFERDVALYESTFAVHPRIEAHDMHPDYASTRFALGRSGATHIAVQHHHAHLAACMAEHQLTGPVIGVIWDGAGWGRDGCVWGGEFFVGDYAAAERVAHLRYVAQPGGDAAAREPWRMALAHLLDAGVDDVERLTTSVDAARRETVRQMIDRRFNTPLTSSVGRLFDAVAALCGANDVSTYEGQAAMWLEALAEQAEPDFAYPFEVDRQVRPLTVDTRPLIRAVVADRLGGVHPAAIARRFHSTLTEIVGAVCLGIRESTGVSDLVLSGGVFGNAMLTAAVTKGMTGVGFNVYRHGTVPPGDGGLSLGQLAVAAARIAAGS